MIGLKSHLFETSKFEACAKYFELPDIGHDLGSKVNALTEWQETSGIIGDLLPVFTFR